MPKLNKCIHREKRQGFVSSYHGQTKYSTRIWFRCKLISLEGNTVPKVKCKGRNCGNYQEVET